MNISRTICSRLQSPMYKSFKSTNTKFYLLHHVKSGTRQQNVFRSFRSSTRHNNSMQSTPFEQMVTGGSIPPNNVIKAALFAGAFTVGTFMGASIMEYENSRRMMMDRLQQAKFAWLRRKTTASNKWEEYRNNLSRYWNELSPGEKVFAPLCALNVLVFCMWRAPSLRNVMINYFTSNPAARAVCWPMFLSTFSHYSAFHLAANMYVLHSFTNAAVLSLGKEQFLAVYLTAGVFASLTSIVYKSVMSQAGLSLGASGAIMAILAYVCTQYPDTRLSILFLPTLTFSAGAAIKVIMGIDLAGCVMGWKFFDHAAHLGGASFGVLWAYLGNELWQKRLPFLTLYHDLRKTK